ncbi:hypothetical protein GCM10010466_23380 [Planomonospora alba]|uniref:Uncharacterized protein n=1 Tax=Planomonospora alba TaxID=161354 RepID=A0ABP6N007_9ACTN
MGRGIRAAAVIAACALLAGTTAGCGTEAAPGGKARQDARAGAGGGTGAAARPAAARPAGVLRQAEDLPEGFSARPRAAWRPPVRPADADCRRVLDAVAGASAARARGAEPGASPERGRAEGRVRADAGARTDGRGPAARGRAVREAVTYSGYGLGELAGVGLEAHPGEGARRRFTALAAALDRCPVVTGPATGAAADRDTLLRVSPLALDRVGDDLRARRLHGRLNGYPYEMHLVFARSGRILMSLVHAGVAEVDAGRTRRLADFLAGRAAALAERDREEA